MKDTPEHDAPAQDATVQDAPEQDAAEPAPAPDAQTRPLVTFAVFAYNQEKYIREAVEGAFSQTYSPLEIILSDDCSTDRTFEIMQEMAAGYVGPHEVRVRRNPINLKTAQHVQIVANEMQGELMVVAAGDDISYKYRVKQLIDVWLTAERRPVIVHSQADLMDEGGSPTGKVAFLRSEHGAVVDINWYARHKTNPILAPTAGYARCLFSDFPPLIGGSVIEDGPMISRGMLRGTFASVNQSLLLQRKSRETAGTGFSYKNLTRWNSFVLSKIISAFNKIQDVSYATVYSNEVRNIENQSKNDIRNLSKLVFKTSLTKNLVGRLWIAILIILYYPASYGLRGRVGFALQFSGLRSESEK